MTFGALFCYNSFMAELKIKFPRKKIEMFCKKNRIQKLAFFGSVLRDDFRPESDVDVLVEFEQGKTPGLSFFRMQNELSEILGRSVDLNTPGFLSKYYRDQILDEAEVQYAAA